MSTATRKKVLVTGASSGIGQAIAHTLAQAGYAVLGVQRREAAPSGSEDIEWIRCDLTGSHDAIVEACGGALDGLVHCAGVYGAAGRHDFLSTAEHEWTAVFATNAEAPFRLTKRLLPLLRRAEQSFIVSVASLAAVSAPGRIAYGAAKAASQCMFTSLACELAGSGVSVVQLLPLRQVVTEGIRARRPRDFDFHGYAAPTLFSTAILDIAASPRGSFNGKIIEV